MLVITRAIEEELVIGDPRNPTAVIKVVALNDKRVRLGVSAPVSVAVHRREVAERVIANGDERMVKVRAGGVDLVARVVAAAGGAAAGAGAGAGA